MPRIEPLRYDRADALTQKLWRQTEDLHGPLGPMQAILARSPAALRAALEWNVLYATVKPFLVEKRILLFARAIAQSSGCEPYAAYLEAELRRAGIDPDAPLTEDKDRALVEYARHLVRGFGQVDDALFGRLREFFTDTQIVEMTVFGALTLLNNIFNNALRVDFDVTGKSRRTESGSAFARSQRRGELAIS